MFSSRTRFALVALSLAAGLFFVSEGMPVPGAALVGVAIMLAAGYWLYGPIWLAMRAFKIGDLNRMAKLLSQVRRPAALTSRQRAYYELMQAHTAVERGQSSEAEAHLRLALEYDLRTDNDRSLAEFMLAQTLAGRGASDESASLLESARARDCRPELIQMIDSFEADNAPAQPGRPADSARER